ncbi:MAG: hypothetical protein LDLANPLL_02061 [Turneriella sp.]|nr:hypothetical protein [Turneriella sp.]
MDANAVDELIGHTAAFRARHLDGAFAYTEKVCDAQTLLSWRDKCIALGLETPLAEERLGNATFFANGHPLFLYLASLKEIAMANASLAWITHESLLSNAFSKIFSWEENTKFTPTYIHLQGANGLARLSLSHFFSGELSEEDHVFLEEYFVSENHPFFVYGISAPTQFIAPLFSKKNQQVEWHLFEADLTRDEKIFRAHGFDELSLREVAVKKSIKQFLCEDSLSAKILFENALSLTALVQIAIGWGLLENAKQKMQRYTSERKQGGKIIAEHAAVRRMLGEVLRTLETVQASLRGVTIGSASFVKIATALSLKATLVEKMHSAATVALQSFGGYGFMRDYGMEKILRGMGHLRGNFGTALEVELFLSAFKEPS